MNEIVILPSRKTSFMFSNCYHSYDILNMVRNASENNIKIKFTDVHEDVTIVIERLHNTEYNKENFIKISVDNAEFIGGCFRLVNSYNSIVEVKIYVGELERNICSFLGERADAIYELTGKSVNIKEVIYIDNNQEEYFNYHMASEFRPLLETVVYSYIQNRWEFFGPHKESLLGTQPKDLLE